MLPYLLLALGAIHYGSANFSADLYGSPDTRPGTWGIGDYCIKEITFRPPPGYRVRILHVRGDVVAWPKTDGATVKPGRYAGILFGLQVTGPEGSQWADYLADNTMLYLQGAVTSEPVRLPFDSDVSALLGDDNKLTIKLADWLNDTGFPIHMEPTMTISFRFEFLTASGEPAKAEQTGN